jgi:hypothetical protein
VQIVFFFFFLLKESKHFFYENYFHFFFLELFKTGFVTDFIFFTKEKKYHIFYTKYVEICCNTATRDTNRKQRKKIYFLSSSDVTVFILSYTNTYYLEAFETATFLTFYSFQTLQCFPISNISLIHYYLLLIIMKVLYNVTKFLTT